MTKYQVCTKLGGGKLKATVQNSLCLRHGSCHPLFWIWLLVNVLILRSIGSVYVARSSFDFMSSVVNACSFLCLYWMKSTFQQEKRRWLQLNTFYCDKHISTNTCNLIQLNINPNIGISYMNLNFFTSCKSIRCNKLWQWILLLQNHSINCQLYLLPRKLSLRNFIAITILVAIVFFFFFF